MTFCLVIINLNRTPFHDVKHDCQMTFYVFFISLENRFFMIVISKRWLADDFCPSNINLDKIYFSLLSLYLQPLEK